VADKDMHGKPIKQAEPWIYKHPRLYEIVDFVDCLGLSRRARERFLEGVKGRVLEVGIGSAISKKWLKAADVFGVDTSVSMLRRAKKRGARVCLANSIHLPFKDKQFDNVLFIFSLRTMSDQERAVEEAVRVGRNLRILDFLPLPSPVEWIGRKIYSQGPLHESSLTGTRFRSTVLLRLFTRLDLHEQARHPQPSSEQRNDQPA